MPPKDFFNLDDGAAEEFFEMFTARAAPRLAAFKRELEARGGPAQSELDGSLESLVGVWTWFVEHAGDAGGDLPPWYEPDPPELAAERLSPAVLHDVDGLAHYMAEVFQRARPGLAWGIGKEDKRLRYEAQNKPVLKDEDGDVNVLSLAYIKGLQHHDGKHRSPDALLQMFAAWGIT